MEEPQTRPTPDERDEEMKQQLIDALLDNADDDNPFSRGQAAKYLNHDFPDVFPIRDDENDRWILEAESEYLDGKRFLGGMVEIVENEAECPECGNERGKVAWFDNGVVTAETIECTVCGYVHWAG